MADRPYYWSRSDGALLTDDRFNAAADGSDHLVVDDDPAVDATVALSIVAAVGDFELCGRVEPTRVRCYGPAVIRPTFYTMSEDHLPAIINPPAPAELHRELALAEGYAQSALAPSTRKAYEHDWLVFATWCAGRGAPPIPATPASVAAFLAGEADRGFRPVTVGRRAAAIAAAHRAQDHPNPCDSGAVAAVMSGIRRQHGTRPLRKAAPLELDPLARLLEPIDTTTLAGRRDRAILLLGFAAALRRSELVALDVEDLEFDTARGLKLLIRGSKTDQERAGTTVAVPYARASNRCAVSGTSNMARGRRDPPRAGVPTDAPR